MDKKSTYTYILDTIETVAIVAAAIGILKFLYDITPLLINFD